MTENQRFHQIIRDELSKDRYADADDIAERYGWSHHLVDMAIYNNLQRYAWIVDEQHYDGNICDERVFWSQQEAKDYADSVWDCLSDHDKKHTKVEAFGPEGTRWMYIPKYGDVCTRF